MRIGRLHTGELLVGLAGVVLLVVMFLDWFEPNVPVQQTGDGWSAWQAFSVIDVILALTVLLALALVVLTLTQRTAALPVTAAVILTALGLLATVLVLFRVLIDQPGMGLGAPDAAIDTTVWAWVGLVCCAAIFYGAYRTLRDESPRGGPRRPAAT